MRRNSLLPRPLALGAIATCALAALLTLPACNIFGPIFVVAQGPPKIDALYKLDEKRPTVVFVGDRTNILPRPRLREVIATSAQDLLIKEGGLKNVIDSRSAYAVVSRDREGQVTNLQELGKQVGAEIVVYASIDSFVIEPSNDRYSLRCTMRARVLDVTQESPRVWPTDPDGYAVSAEYRQPPGKEVATNVDVQEIQNALAEQAGKALAQLFYTHERAKAAARGN